MARIISIHEYDLKPGSNPAQFEHALWDAEARGLFELPGLMTHHFVRGVKGARQDTYAAVWIYESREAWERLWAPWSARSSARSIRQNGGFGRRSCWPRS